MKRFLSNKAFWPFKFAKKIRQYRATNNEVEGGKNVRQNQQEQQEQPPANQELEQQAEQQPQQEQADFHAQQEQDIEMAEQSHGSGYHHQEEQEEIEGYGQKSLSLFDPKPLFHRKEIIYENDDIIATVKQQNYKKLNYFADLQLAVKFEPKKNNQIPIIASLTDVLKKVVIACINKIKARYLNPKHEFNFSVSKYFSITEFPSV